MTELKTLKDLTLKMPDNIYYRPDDLVKSKGFTFIPDDILKQEAIKWIKESQKHILFIFENPEQGDEILKIYEQGRISVLKEFFNITEEDLK